MASLQMLMDKVFDDKDIELFSKMIECSGRVVLTCHVRPDGDAIGSTLGLMYVLRSLGKDVYVVIPDQAPRSLSFLPGFSGLCVFSRHEEYCKRLIGECDLLICCDFNKPSRQDRLEPVVQGAKCTKVMIDHHQDPDYFCDLTFSRPEMSSTCEAVFRIVAALGLYENMSVDAATCLLTGLITDTRNFSVNCSNPEVYEILVRLLDKGCDKQRIVREALEKQSLASLKLQSYAISEKMQILEKHRVAVTTLDRDELKRFGYERGDTEGLVNMPLNVRGIAASFFLREDDDCIKVSARSVGRYPVSKVCEDLYGGGGHLQAAGGEFHGTLQECVDILLKALPDYDCYLPSRMEKIGN